MDINDNYPLFPQLKQVNSDKTFADNEDPIFEMYENVDENSKLLTKISQLKVVDIDKNDNITFKIMHSTDPNKSILIKKYTGKFYFRNRILLK